MAIPLKDLDKAIKKITKQVVDVLESGQLAKTIGERLEKDVKKAMDIGKEPDGVRLTNVAKFTPKTKKEYKRQGLRTKARFEKTGDVKRSIKSTTKKGQVKISSTGSKKDRDKVLFLKSTKTKSGTKEARIIFDLTRRRIKIVANTIRDFLQAKFN